MQPIRGFKDLNFEDYNLFDFVVNVAKKVSKLHDFNGCITPIMEFTEVFSRTLGDDSDIVSKEMYSFLDRNEESLTLRPEFTAGIARNYISNGLEQYSPIKLFSYGPLFRYERPQKGRYRQFHQINFESLGNQDFTADVEIICLANQLVKELGLSDDVSLEINSLGCDATRESYKSVLVNYLSKYKNDLSDESKRRLLVNPMRILDSKDENDKKILIDAPSLKDSYTKESREFFDKILLSLNDLNINYNLNEKLVRGLDYYSHTAFEFTTNKLGSQNAIFAGGRYDRLISIMGGKETPAIGFAGGIERISHLVELKKQSINKEPLISVIPFSNEEKIYALNLLNELRQNGIRSELIHKSNIGKSIKKANKNDSKIALIIGSNEIESSQIKTKFLYNSLEESIDRSNLVNRIKEAINEL